MNDDKSTNMIALTSSILVSVFPSFLIATKYLWIKCKINQTENRQYYLSCIVIFKNSPINFWKPNTHKQHTSQQNC